MLMSMLTRPRCGHTTKKSSPALPHRSSIIAAAAAALALASSFQAHSQVIELALDSAWSVSSIDLQLEAEIPGSVIGNYDPVTNPQGTLTRPGYFGGSGNLPVAISLDPTLTVQRQTRPVGNMRLRVNLDNYTLTLANLHADLLAGETVPMDLHALLTYETFRTFQPDSIFISSGVAVPLPLGQGELTSFLLEQVSPPVTATLTLHDDDQGSYHFLLQMPVTFTATAQALDQSFTTGPLPWLLTISGTLAFKGNDDVTVTLSTHLLTAEEVHDSLPGAFSNVPVDLPTILPPGQTVHLLLSGQMKSLSLSLDLPISVTAHGIVPQSGDTNGDGAVNVNDVLAVISSWGACPVCSADINGDGVVDVLDLLMVIQHWGR